MSVLLAKCRQGRRLSGAVVDFPEKSFKKKGKI